VPAQGGEAVAATELDAPRQSVHGSPAFLPDGRRFLFFAGGGDPEAGGLYLGSLDGEPPRRLSAADRWGVAHLGPDRIVFLQQGALLAHRFDPERGVLTGDPVTLAASVEGFSVSATGIVAHRAHQDTQTEMVWFDRKGSVLSRLAAAGVNGPELAPDERRLVFDRVDEGKRDIWVSDLERGALTRFTTHVALDGYPVWSPDGSRIAFHSNRNGTIDLWIKPSSGAGAEELLLEQPDSEWPIDWSRDGRFLLYQRSDLKKGWDLWALPMTGADRTPVAVATTPFEEHMGEFSPDGRWVVYDTNESGRFEIVAQAFPQANERLPVSTVGGVEPRWSADGTEIYFVAGGKMMVAPVKAKGPTLEFGTPVALFSTQIKENPFKFEYAVSRDGRFLVNSVVAETSAPPITLILNAKP
jgi:hypothetical protein